MHRDVWPSQESSPPQARAHGATCDAGVRALLAASAAPRCDLAARPARGRFFLENGKANKLNCFDVSVVVICSPRPQPADASADGLAEGLVAANQNQPEATRANQSQLASQLSSQPASQFTHQPANPPTI